MANRHEDLQTLLAKLKLSSMAKSCSQLALKAAKEKLSHEAFLYELVRLECEEREQRRIERYLSGSKLPREKTFRTFQWDRLTPALRGPRGAVAHGTLRGASSHCRGRWAAGRWEKSLARCCGP
jgi:hypothetical protein